MMWFMAVLGGAIGGLLLVAVLVAAYFVMQQGGD